VLESAILLMMNSLFLMLRISPGDSFPRPLSREKEREYLQRWQQGDLEAHNLLVEHNLRLVAHIVKKYYSADDADDLISIGTIGLIKGVSTYRPDKGVRLATYASKCIENEILMYFRSMRKSAGDLSLSESLDADGDAGALSLMDVVAQEDEGLERVELLESCSHLEEYVERALTEREAKIIRRRDGRGGGEALSQRETAARCAISRSYVSRIEKRALEKLREALEE
jgi:RNA polymerase sporulation-specific sigma factor